MNHANEIASIVYVNVKAILYEVGVKKLCCISFSNKWHENGKFCYWFKKSQNAITLEGKLKVAKLWVYNS